MAEDGPIAIEDCPKDLLLFRAAVNKIFRDISESVSETEFSNCWTILKKKPKASHQVFASMKDLMYKNMEDQMNDYIEQDNLIDKFNTLRRLSEESKNQEDHIAWRPPGNVMEHLRSLDGQEVKKHLEKLEKFVTELEAENQKLVEEVAKGRASAKMFDQKADHLLNQQKRIRLEFEKTAKRLEGDIKKMH